MKHSSLINIHEKYSLHFEHLCRVVGIVYYLHFVIFYFMSNGLDIIQVPNQREQQSPCVQWELVPKIVIKYFSKKLVNIVDLLLRSSVRDETSLTLGQELNSLNLGGHVSQVLGRLLLAVPSKHIRTCLHQQQNTLTISISEMSLFLKAL